MRGAAALAGLGAVFNGLAGIGVIAAAFLLPADAVHTATVGGNMLLFSVIPLLLLAGYLMDASDRPAEPKPGAEVVRLRDWRPIAIFAFLAALAAAQPAHAQQTIFNVPSTDVLDRGKVYGELDVTWKPVDSKFSSFVPRVVVGTGGGVEVGLNVTGNIQPGADVTTLQPAFKWKAYDGGDNGWAVVVGDTVSLPVRNRPYDAGNYAYAAVSRTFSTGTRVTAGGYHFSENVVAPNAQRAGGQFGVEQPVNRYLSINADWITGKHASGYFTPGVAFKPHPKVTSYVGYSIGNTGASRGNHFVYTAIGINFN